MKIKTDVPLMPQPETVTLTTHMDNTLFACLQSAAARQGSTVQAAVLEGILAYIGAHSADGEMRFQLN